MTTAGPEVDAVVVVAFPSGEQPVTVVRVSTLGDLQVRRPDGSTRWVPLAWLVR